MIEIGLSRLGNQEIFTLGVRNEQIIKGFDVESLGIKLYYDNFVSALGVYKTSFEKLPVSAELISQKDETRETIISPCATTSGIIDFIRKRNGMKNRKSYSLS